MAFRSIAQVAVGVVAGAVLVGVPTWAVASQQDDSPGSPSDMSSMMGDSHMQMMMDEMSDEMSAMMKDPEMREQMRSMMSDLTGEKE